MNTDADLAALADLCGILPAYHDLHGQQRITSPETQRALLAADGVDVSSPDAIRDSLAALRHRAGDRWFPEEVIVEVGREAHLGFGLGATWDLRADIGNDPVAEGAAADHITLPPLAPDIYVLTARASGRVEEVTVLAAPARLPSIADLTGRDRLWGLNCALYGVRSARNAGLGDFDDLACMAEIAGGQGAGFLGINPIHNMGFADRMAISPYSPSHRGYLNSSHIALDAVPGLGGRADPAAFAPIRATQLVDYAAHKPAHSAALEALFAAFGGADADAQADFEAFRQAGGAELARFARFEALSERHGPDWTRWPDDPDQPAAGRAAFHIWLQWVADRQLAAAQARARDAGMPLGIYLDLAVGPRRDGAEAWCERDAIAQGVSIGAPPDHLSPEGQKWNLAAFAPAKLRALRYAPLRRVLAGTMRHAGVIRIDHVLGLNRSFWIADDGSPGGYIRQPFEALLAVIRIEAARHACAVIGEDLGLVPDGFREVMRGYGFYGYSVLQYEKDHDGTFRTPGDGAQAVLACFATHDTPTVQGYASGRDIDWWRDLGWIDTNRAEEIRRARLAELARLPREGDFASSVLALLAHSPAALVAVQLDDVLDAVEAQNLPGTIDAHPNWRRKYAVELDDLRQDTRMHSIASLMRDAGRAHPQGGPSQ